MKLSYAAHADVLYIVFEETPNKCVYVETESGVVCRTDEVTARVVGITIPHFKRRVAAGEPITIPEIG